MTDKVDKNLEELLAVIGSAPASASAPPVVAANKPIPALGPTPERPASAYNELVTLLGTPQPASAAAPPAQAQPPLMTPAPHVPIWQPRHAQVATHHHADPATAPLGGGRAREIPSAAAATPSQSVPLHPTPQPILATGAPRAQAMRQPVSTATAQASPAMWQQIAQERKIVDYYCRFCMQKLKTFLASAPNRSQLEQKFAVVIRDAWGNWIKRAISKRDLVTTVSGFLKRTCPQARAVNVEREFDVWLQTNRMRSAARPQAQSQSQTKESTAAPSRTQRTPMPVAGVSKVVDSATKFTGGGGAPGIVAGPALLRPGSGGARKGAPVAATKTTAVSAPKPSGRAAMVPTASKTAQKAVVGNSPDGQALAGARPAGKSVGGKGVARKPISKKPGPVLATSKQKQAGARAKTQSNVGAGKKRSNASLAAPDRSGKGPLQVRTNEPDVKVEAGTGSGRPRAGSKSSLQNTDDNRIALDIVSGIVDIAREESNLDDNITSRSLEGNADEEDSSELLISSVLTRKIGTKAVRLGLDGGVSRDVVDMISLAARERLTAILENLHEIVAARTESARSEWMTEPTGPNIHDQLNEMGEAEEQALLRAAEMRMQRRREERERLAKEDAGDEKEADTSAETDKKERAVLEKRRKEYNSQRIALTGVVASLSSRRRKASAMSKESLSQRGSVSSSGTGFGGKGVNDVDEGGGSPGQGFVCERETHVNKDDTDEQGGQRQNSITITLQDAEFLMRSDPKLRKSNLYYKWLTRLGVNTMRDGKFKI